MGSCGTLSHEAVTVEPNSGEAVEVDSPATSTTETVEDKSVVLSDEDISYWRVVAVVGGVVIGSLVTKLVVIGSLVCGV